MQRRFPNWRVGLIIVLAVAAMVLFGCTTLEPGPEETLEPPPTASATASPIAVTATPTPPPVTPLPPNKAKNLWQRIQEDGVIIVGVSSGYPPFSYHQPDGSVDGFDVALMREIAQRLGIDVIFQDAPFQELLDKVQSGEVDAIIGGLAITPERSQRVDFTKPYLTGNTVLIANEDADIGEMTSVTDLAAWRIAAELGTLYGDWLLQQADQGLIPTDNIKLYPDLHQAINALIAGEADLLLVDDFTASDLVRQTRGKLQLLNKRAKVTLTFLPLTDRPLHSTQWVLSAYANQDGMLVPALTGVQVTAEIDDAVIKGSAGCNTYSADLLLKEKSIRITPPVITRKTCAEPEGIMEQENQFLTDLRLSEAYKIEGDTLIFMDKKGATSLIFRAKPLVNLANITWELYAYGPLLQPYPAPDEAPVTLTVNADGTISGNAGCNPFSGKVTREGDAVRFELGPSTTKACDATANSMETTFLSALASVEQAEVQQDHLLLYYNGGLDALKFRAKRQNPLQFSAWQLFTFGVPAKKRYPLPTTQLTALFGKDALTGSAGCNVFRTSYSVNGQKLKISKIALTRKLCPDNQVSDQETAYVKALRNSTSYRFIGVKTIATDLYRQEYGIAVPKGAEALLEQLNDALRQLAAEDVIDQLSQRYLPQQPIAPEEPQPTATPGCTDKLKWIADLTYDDNNMTNPPVLDPGSPFTKKWRVKNVGTCTWTEDYYLDFVRGNRPGADMGGVRTYLQGEIKPGQTYDLALDLKAPLEPGTYQGFWRLHNTQGAAFAELWVGIKVAKPKTPIPTPTPTLTPTPAPIVQFIADKTHIQEGACTTLYWNTLDVSHTYLFEEGEDWQDKEVPAQGNQEVCPAETTTYILGVVLPDDSRQTTSLTITVSRIQPPNILTFSSAPTEQVVLGQSVQLHWDIRGDVTKITLSANEVPILANAPAFGALQHTPEQLGTIKYTLLAEGPGGAQLADLVINVVESAPEPTETPAPEPTETSVPEPTATPGQDELIGPTWGLVSRAQTKMSPIPTLPDTQITLQLTDDGAYSGQAGCNTYSGTYRLSEGNVLLFDPPVTTRQYCKQPEGVMEQEEAYLSLLPKVNAFEIDPTGQQLTLRTENKWQLVFEQLLTINP